MNSTDLVFHCQLNANQDYFGTILTGVSPSQIPVQLGLITMELNVFLINHVKREKSGTIPFLNVFVHKAAFSTVLNA